MEVRKIVSKVVGAAQSGIGVLTIILAYILYYNLFNVQSMLNASAQNVPLYNFSSFSVYFPLSVGFF